VKPELEYEGRRDGKKISGNICIHNPMAFQEKVCASGIRSFL